jgi:hypothetical protein
MPLNESPELPAQGANAPLWCVSGRLHPCRQPGINTPWKHIGLTRSFGHISQPGDDVERLEDDVHQAMRKTLVTLAGQAFVVRCL